MLKFRGFALSSLAFAGVLGFTACGLVNSARSVRPANQQVYVAYAGSLQWLNDRYLGPGFHKATGISYRGQGGGSYGMAHLVSNKTIDANVFESIGSGPLKVLGSQVDYAIGVASSPLVIAYSPSSPYVKTLNAIKRGQLPLRRLFTLMARPGFHLGRTNPATDPQGQAFYMMIQSAQRRLGLKPGTANQVLGSLENPHQIFAEESILSQLQAGQLDASSAFLSEAVQRHLDYIPLPNGLNFGDPADAKRYSRLHLTLASGKIVHGALLEVYVAPLAHSFDLSAANRFVAYVLSKAGLDQFKAEGFRVTRPMILGKRSAMAPGIRQELGQARG